MKFEYVSNRITKAWDNLDRTVNYTYDTNGRLKTVTDPNGGVWEYTYDTSHRMLTVKDPRLITVVTNEYDTNGRVSKQTVPGGEFHTFAYTTDLSGNITQTDVTDSQGTSRRVTFNSEGYTLTDTRAFDTSEAQTITYQRQAGTNFVTSVTDALGRRTDYTRDTMGNVTSVKSVANIPAATLTTNFAYQSLFNRLTSVTDPLNHATTYGYDAKGNLTSVNNALGNATTFTNDSFGQPVSVTDPLGRITQFTYGLGGLLAVTDPSGNTNKRFLDAGVRVLSTTDSMGNVTMYEYDGQNRLTRTTDSLAGQTNFTYDASGNLLGVTDAKSQTFSFTYDNESRLVTRTDPLLRTETYQYDVRGNLTQFTDRNGQTITHTYDRHNRRTQTTYADLSATIFTYDSGSRLTQINDSVSGIITRTYDNHDRLTSEATPQGSVSYSYDGAGRRASMTVAGQPTVNYAYDNVNRLIQITQGSSIVSFGYDAAGRRNRLTLPNGILVEYGYDVASRLAGITYKKGLNVLGNITYEYDATGNRTKIGGSFARTGVPDPVTSIAYTANNQQTTFGDKTLTYDNNGNVSSVTDSNGTTNYTWDARNQLVGISGPGVSASFVYDAIGRRIRRIVNSTTTEFLHDGIDPVQETSGAAVLANILTGLGIDERFTRTDASGTQTFLPDALGSIVAVADAGGTIQTQYTYQPFGKTTTSGSTSSNSYQYTGRENDGTGLYYYRARYYHPDLQRFISEDPIGMAGSGVNFYSYVANKVMNYSDPTGLFASGIHSQITRNAAVAAGCSKNADLVAQLVFGVDWPWSKPGTLRPSNAFWHGMCRPENANNPAKGAEQINNYIQDKLKSCKLPDLADALHAAQDTYAEGHRGCQPWYGGLPGAKHLWYDFFPDSADVALAEAASRNLIDEFMKRCPCACQ
jgi:RHS repeat-associated protein